jgi:hypothetical protein
MAQVVGPEFKPRYIKTNKTKTNKKEKKGCYPHSAGQNSARCPASRTENLKHLLLP